MRQAVTSRLHTFSHFFVLAALSRKTNQLNDTTHTHAHTYTATSHKQKKQPEVLDGENRVVPETEEISEEKSDLEEIEIMLDESHEIGNHTGQ